MGELSPWHLLILAAVFVLLFGAKRLPDAARSLGRSMRIFKTELKDLRDDDRPQQSAAQLPTAQPPAAVAQPPAAVAQPPAAPPAEAPSRASAPGEPGAGS